MARPRVHDLNLPKGVSWRFGAYHYRKGGKSRKLAEDLPSALREYGKILEAEGAVQDPNTLPRLLDKFLVEHPARGFRGKPLADKTVEMYSRCIGLLKPIVIDFRPSQLTTDEVNAIVRSIEKKNGPTTASQCRATLSAVYSFAKEHEPPLVKSNPVTDARKVKLAKRTRYVETSELNTIGAAGLPVVQAAIDLAYVTGQRVSDVVDLGVDAEDNEYVTLIQKKTGHRMKVRRTPNLIQVIKACTATCARSMSKAAKERGATPSTIIFNRSGDAYTRDGFLTLWQRARKASGIQDATFRDIRAKSLTDADELGMDAQKLAGHKSRATTEGYLRGRRAFVTDPLPLKKRPAAKRVKKAAKA
jgi:integrase